MVRVLQTLAGKYRDQQSCAVYHDNDLHRKNCSIGSEKNGVEFGCQFAGEDNHEEVEIHGSAAFHGPVSWLAIKT
jgi:hypothetical protein